tara:strand:+ start:648 stop:899 length:252 start_codon:yes stop_codon:yes gene_type:complete
MSSEDIDYFDENNLKLKLENMDKEQLIEHILICEAKKRFAIKKYHKTDKGRQKTREASKKYYEKHKQEILEKRKNKYQSNKNN